MSIKGQLILDILLSNRAPMSERQILARVAVIAGTTQKACKESVSNTIYAGLVHGYIHVTNDDRITATPLKCLCPHGIPRQSDRIVRKKFRPTRRRRLIKKRPYLGKQLSRRKAAKHREINRSLRKMGIKTRSTNMRAFRKDGKSKVNKTSKKKQQKLRKKAISKALKKLGVKGSKRNLLAFSKIGIKSQLKKTKAKSKKPKSKKKKANKRNVRANKKQKRQTINRSRKRSHTGKKKLRAYGNGNKRKNQVKKAIRGPIKPKRMIKRRRELAKRANQKKKQKKLPGRIEMGALTKNTLKYQEPPPPKTSPLQQAKNNKRKRQVYDRSCKAPKLAKRRA